MIDLTRCHDMAIALAPELGRRPLYVVTADDLGDIPRSPSCQGWATGDNRAIAKRLGDRWRGAGPTICLDPVSIAEHCQPDSFDLYVAGVVVHEAAHILPAPAESRYRLPAALTADMQELALRSHLSSVPENPTTDPHHDGRFVRRAMHLYIRALLLGFAVPHDIHISPCVCLEYYLPILLREVVDMRSKTFAEIEATDPPIAFLAQWKADTALYNRVSSYRGSL